VGPRACLPVGRASNGVDPAPSRALQGSSAFLISMSAFPLSLMSYIYHCVMDSLVEDEVPDLVTGLTNLWMRVYTYPQYPEAFW